MFVQLDNYYQGHYYQGQVFIYDDGLNSMVIHIDINVRPPNNKQTTNKEDPVRQFNDFHKGSCLIWGG